MSYTFRVVFDGVCAHVPNERFFYYDNAASVFVSQAKASMEDKEQKVKPARSLAILLPDLRRPGKPYVPSSVPLRFPVFREPHFPLLQFDLKDLREGTTRRVDLVSRDISSYNEEGNLFLRREQIRFNLNAENASIFSYADYVPDDPCQVKPDPSCPDQADSLWWLTDLKQIVCPQDADAAVVNPKFLPSYRGPFPDGLIARIECTGGRLRTFDFNRDLDGEPLPWRFAAPSAHSTDPGSWNRVLSNSVALEFFDVQDEVHIELRRLANEVIIEELVLAPGPGASRPIVEIHISNLEPDRLFQAEGFSRSALPDFDFQPFYELSQISEDRISGLPIPNPGRETFFGLREKPCAGGVMDATGGA